MVNNGAVEGTLLLWEGLARAKPELSGNWRWQMCLLRANYDVYIRRRLINESHLEDQANAILAQSPKIGAARAMDDAERVLAEATTKPISVELRTRIFDLCEQLFHSIGLQTSVDKYYAIGEERGAVLDFVDLPLNNRWWLEDQFKSIRTLGLRVRNEPTPPATGHMGTPRRGKFLRRCRQHRQVTACGSLRS